MATKYSKKGTLLSLSEDEELSDYLERKKKDLINNQVALAKKHLDLGRGKKILEFGCFHGLFTEMINKEKKARCTGIDINLIRKMKGLVKYDSKKIPFGEKYFDSFVSFEVIEHVEDINNAMQEINRVLKIGAKGIVSTPNKLMVASFDNAHNSVLGHLKQITGITPECYKLYSYGELVRLFEKNGFSYKLLSNKPFWVKKGFMFLLKKERDLDL